MFALLAAAFATKAVIVGPTNRIGAAITCVVDGSETELRETR